MRKRLKLETIVPKSLYVQRKADTQLKNIIEDMSRPASILVARQMGKTNLLLNTKRELEDDKTIFVYIDLSKIDNDMRDCFRYIIDTAIDTNLPIFEEIEEDILKIREKNRLPYREHEQELLLLLKKLNGKIIIVLDEIDSMKRFDFSDQFFSQIRSVYFASRVNYEEFKNLTYILSGVLEPSEIIQDKTKSPFNISEKVYLNDFSKKEFLEFIKRIDFNFFSNDVINQIYDWTNGHPRMIWNICAMLEEKYHEANSLDITDVDKVIEELYFLHSDISPIDHIKNLLSENHDIVQTLLELKQGITLNITDQVKNKLYLYGIIDIVNSGEIEIKNKIIDTVLSEEYLKNILYVSQTPYELGLSLYDKGEYKLALTEFGKYLKSEDIINNEENYCHYQIGLCLLKLHEYRYAIESFKNAKFDKDGEGKIYYQNEFDMGVCYYHLGDYVRAMIYYEKVLENSKDIRQQISAQSNKVAIYIKENKDLEFINKSIEKVVLQLDKNKNELLKVYYSETYATIHFNLAELYKKKKDDSHAIELYKNILEVEGIEKFKVNIFLELLELEFDEEYLYEIFKIIKENRFRLDEHSEISFSINSLCRYVYVLLSNNKEDLLNEVLNYCQNSYTEFKSKCSVISICARFYEDDHRKQEALYKYSLKYEDSEIASQECYEGIYINLVYSHYQQRNYLGLKEHAEKTIEVINNINNRVELTIEEYHILNIIIGTMTQQGDFVKAHKLYKKIEVDILPKIPENFAIYKAIFLDKKHKLIIDASEKKDLSQECLKVLRESAKNDNVISSKDINILKSKHVKYLHDNSKKKIGKNDPCFCGSNKKYKNCCK